MRVKRLKKYRKYSNFYKIVYKFKPPFKILVDGNFLHQAVSNDFNLRENIMKIIQENPVLIMTKCIMRELEDQASQLGFTLKEAKRIVKESCKHPGGILPPDECIKNFVGKKNEPKVFVCTNDEDLRNELRNLGVVPIFFFKYGVLVMDAPTEISEEKHRIKEQLKNEPTMQEKTFLKESKQDIQEIQKEEKKRFALKRKEQVKDTYCMGFKLKKAKGPNPLSVKKKKIRISQEEQDEKEPVNKRRRKRKGKRSRALSKLKKELAQLNGINENQQETC